MYTRILPVFLLAGCSSAGPLDLSTPDHANPGTDSPAAPGTGSLGHASGGSANDDSDVHAFVPRADDAGNLPGFHYAGERAEQLTWGGKNFSVDPVDGTFWLADTAGDQVIHADRDGLVLGVVDTSGDVVGGVDVAVNATELVVVDASSQPPRLVEYTKDGAFLESTELPMAWEGGSVTGVELDEAGTIVVDRILGFDRQRVIKHEGGVASFEVLPGTTWNDTVPESPYARLRPAAIDPRNAIATQTLIPSTDGYTYVYVEEARQGDWAELEVDTTVRRFSSAGEQVAVARVNHRDRYTFVDFHGMQFDSASNAILTLMPTPDGVEIVPLEFVDHLDVLPALDSVDSDNADVDSDDSVPTSSAACVSGSTMTGVAWTLATTTYSSSTTDAWSVYSNSAACSSRSVPRYLGSESFTGEPYAWGQFNTSASMTSRMGTPSSYYKAGDADGTYAVPNGCAVGTDCSGLTTNMWALTTKLSTTNIANAAYTSADTGAWDRGEVYVKSGTHVVNFDSYDSTGNMWWYEATTDGSLDRVAFRTKPLSYWTGYTHRRYVNQCP